MLNEMVVDELGFGHENNHLVENGSPLLHRIGNADA